MARRTLNRREMRAAHEAAEARDREKDEDKDEEEDEDEDEDEEDDEEEGSDDTEDSDEEEDSGDDDEDRPRKKKKKKVAKAKAPPKPKAAKRTRTAKVVRMKVVWTVFNNSHQAVARFDYPKKAEAEALAAKLMADKKSTHFVQAMKEPMEEKKEKEAKDK